MEGSKPEQAGRNLTLDQGGSGRRLAEQVIQTHFENILEFALILEANAIFEGLARTACTGMYLDFTVNRLDGVPR